MKNDFNFRVVSAASVLALLLSASAFLLVGAQDATPTATLEEPSATASETTAATEEPSATATPDGSTATLEASATETASETLEFTPTETETPTGSLTATETGTATETPSVTPTPELPAEGPIQPLVLDATKVIWCPATVAVPVEGAPCSAAFTELTDLFADLFASDPALDGTIWVGNSYPGVVPAGLNGLLFPNMSTKKLTFKGGWIGSGNTINTAAPSPLAHRLEVTNWASDLTLNDLDINTPTDPGLGLIISTTLNITLTRVTVANTSGSGTGASLFNDLPGGTGNIVVTNSHFDDNDNLGVTMSSFGNITVTGSSANGNVSRGMVLDNSILAPGKTVTVTGSSINGNMSIAGLSINSQGNITLTNTTVNSNTVGAGRGGAELDNQTFGGVGNVVISGGTFNSNVGGGAGLEVDSNGNITLTGVTAKLNTGLQGMHLDNSAASAVKTITVNGSATSEINENAFAGLVASSDGLITLKDVTANYNGIVATNGNGVLLDNVGGTAGVTLTGTNIFSGNYNSGIAVGSNGPIKLNNLIANANANGYGASISNNTALDAQPVTLTGTSQFNFNQTGLDIASNGAVSVSNVTANSNTLGGGVGLQNNNGSFTGGVTLTGVNSMSENNSIGLDVNSFGPITVNNVTADDNGGFGMRLNNGGAATFQKVTVAGMNSASSNVQSNVDISSRGAIAVNSITANESQTDRGVSLSNTAGGDTAAKQAITMTGTNVINGNANHGLYAESFGAITVNNVTANENGLIDLLGLGAWLVNDTASTPMAVTVSGVNSFSGNYNSGLAVTTDGAFKANSVTANANGIPISAGHGLELDSDDPLQSVGGATLTGTNTFNGNGLSGLNITTRGTIALNNITANSNLGGNGLTATNLSAGTSTPKNITLTGMNTFNSNVSTGVRLDTYGDLVVNNIHADNNGTSGTGYGAELRNEMGSLLQIRKLTIAGTNVITGNDDGGLQAKSLGAIIASNLTVSDNGEVLEDGGALLQNDYAGSTAGITLTGSHQFNDNINYGLNVFTNGAITASNITATGTTVFPGDGVVFDNDGGLTAQPIKLTGTNVFFNNYGDGLDITSKGAVSLSNVTASENDNSNHGVRISNLPATSDQPVTLSGINVMSDNEGDGLNVNSEGAISVANLTANGNLTGYGAYLANDTSAAPQKVALTGTNTFNDNAAGGLHVQSEGAITSATKLTANGNDFRGVSLNNDNGSSTAAITLSGTNVANLNARDGFYINSFGIVTLNNATAIDNGETNISGPGVFIDNRDGATPADIKITGTNVFNSNYGPGLQTITHGAITTNNLTASYSEADIGAQLASLTEGKAITMTGNNYFNGNDSFGLIATGFGPITANNINASLNGSGTAGPGAEITNSASTSPRTVKMNGTNVFIGNSTGHGLTVSSDGAVTLNNVRAHNNGMNGLNVVNNVDPSDPAVTLTGVNAFRNNTLGGVSIDSDGVVTVNKVTAEGNLFGDGLFINPTPNNITLMCGTFTNNSEWGVDVETTAIFKRVGVFASGNVFGDISVLGPPSSTVIVRNCP